MAHSGPMLVTTREGIEVKARRRLEKPGAFEGLMDELQQKFSAAQDGQPIVIGDLDVAQNKLSSDQFEALFTQLGAHSVRVLRFRMFGCATLNDEVMRAIGDYFRLLNQENTPTEMHLSDCAITAEGFGHLMSALEETELYPAPPPNGSRPQALYLRLENNFISEDAIKEKVDAGVLKPYKKSGGSRSNDPSVKVDLVVMQEGKFQQKQGEPPAPEDAPAPKEVNDQRSWNNQGGWNGGWGAGGAQSWGWSGGGSQNQWQGWSAGGTQRWPAVQSSWQTQQQNSWKPAQTQAPAARPWMAAQRPAVVAARPVAARPVAARSVLAKASAAPMLAKQAGGGLRPAGLVRPAGGVPGGLTPKVVLGGKGQAGAWRAAGAAQDRSRTPVARTAAAAATLAPAKGSKAPLPKPWEEHWSEEYQIPYFWNVDTGESLWERPTA